MLSLSALGCSGGSESLSSMSRFEVGVMEPLLFVPLPLPPRGTRCSPRWSPAPSRLPVPRNPRFVAVGVASVSARSSEEKKERERERDCISKVWFPFSQTTASFPPQMVIVSHVAYCYVG